MRIFSLAFLGAGALLLAIGAHSVINTRKFLARAVAAPGVVIENVWRPDSEGSGTYHPRVRFRAQGGQELVFLSRSGSQPPAYAPNDTVEVLYDPNDPNDAAIHSFWSQWLTAVVLFSLAGAACVTGLIPLLLRLKDHYAKAVAHRPLGANAPVVKRNAESDRGR